MLWVDNEDGDLVQLLKAALPEKPVGRLFYGYCHWGDANGEDHYLFVQTVPRKI